MSWLHSRFTATAKRSLQQRSPSGRRRRTQLQVEPMRGAAASLNLAAVSASPDRQRLDRQRHRGGVADPRQHGQYRSNRPSFL